MNEFMIEYMTLLNWKYYLEHREEMKNETKH